MTCWTSVLVYPNSLSYQENTAHKSPSTTLVKLKSIIAAYGSPTISEDTNWSVVVLNIPFQRSSFSASLKILFISSAVVVRSARKVRQDKEPVTLGTLIEAPSNLPANDLTARVVAIAAPVHDGEILVAAALPRRQS